MRTFQCDSCGGDLFFENDTCLACKQQVGFRPDQLAMCTVVTAAALGLAQCRNWTDYAACNWFVTNGAAAEQGYCDACSLNEVVPDLADAHRRELWVETERAKRRLIFTLIESDCLCSVAAKSSLCASDCSPTNASTRAR